MSIQSTPWSKLLIFSLFLLAVNLLAGFVAVWLNYPSLFNTQVSFSEYAIPLPFTWALAHWPSILIYGIPLLYLTKNKGKFLFYYRLFCAVSFALLLLQITEKIPFVLFPAVDAFTGLTLSLAIVPPNRESNPALFPSICFVGFVIFGAAGYITYDYMRHRTPELSTRLYSNGSFELVSIDIYKNLHEMRITVELKERLSTEDACSAGQELAANILNDYPFDSSYNKYVEVWLNPSSQDLDENNGSPYPLGEISLNEVHKDSSGLFPCSLRYK